MHRATAAAIAVVAVLAALTGCAGPDQTGPAASPLDQYLDAAWGGDLGSPDQRARLQEESQRRDELVAQCMAAAGFEYTPIAAQAAASSAPAAEYEPESREWVQQYGYGIVVSPGRTDPLPPAGELVDANQEYVAALPETERAAYYAALYGTPGDAAPGGCHGWAQAELEGTNPLTSGEHTELIDAINRFYADLQSVPELVELNTEWAACMAAAGHAGLAVQRDAETSIAEAVAEYYGAQTEWTPDDPALAELAEREKDLALADLGCREETDFRARESTVTVQLEEAFVAEHRSALEAFKSDAEAAE